MPRCNIDLKLLGWREREMYAMKSTFITLAIEAGANPRSSSIESRTRRRSGARSMATIAARTGTRLAARSRSYECSASESRRPSSRLLGSRCVLLGFSLGGCDHKQCDRGLKDAAATDRHVRTTPRILANFADGERDRSDREFVSAAADGVVTDEHEFLQVRGGIASRHRARQRCSMPNDFKRCLGTVGNVESNFEIPARESHFACGIVPGPFAGLELVIVRLAVRTNLDAIKHPALVARPERCSAIAPAATTIPAT